MPIILWDLCSFLPIFECLPTYFKASPRTIAPAAISAPLVVSPAYAWDAPYPRPPSSIISGKTLIPREVSGLFLRTLSDLLTERDLLVLEPLILCIFRPQAFASGDPFLIRAIITQGNYEFKDYGKSDLIRLATISRLALISDKSISILSQRGRFPVFVGDWPDVFWPGEIVFPPCIPKFAPERYSPSFIFLNSHKDSRLYYLLYLRG